METRALVDITDAQKYCSACLEQIQLSSRLDTKLRISEFSSNSLSKPNRPANPQDVSQTVTQVSDMNESHKSVYKQWFGNRCTSDNYKPESLGSKPMISSILAANSSHSLLPDITPIHDEATVSLNYERFGTKRLAEAFDQRPGLCLSLKTKSTGPSESLTLPLYHPTRTSSQILGLCHFNGKQKPLENPVRHGFRGTEHHQLGCNCYDRLYGISEKLVPCSSSFCTGSKDVFPCSESIETCLSLDASVCDSKDQKTKNKFQRKHSCDLQSTRLTSPDLPLNSEASQMRARENSFSKLQNKCPEDSHLADEYPFKRAMASKIWTVFNTSEDCTSSKGGISSSETWSENGEFSRVFDCPLFFPRSTLPKTNRPSLPIRIYSKNMVTQKSKTLSKRTITATEKQQRSSGKRLRLPCSTSSPRLCQTLSISLAITCFFYASIFIDCTMALTLKVAILSIATFFLMILLDRCNRIRKPILLALLLSLTKRGRYVYIYLILTTLLSGPIKNGFSNMMDLGPTLNCILETSDKPLAKSWTLSSHSKDKTDNIDTSLDGKGSTDGENLKERIGYLEESLLLVGSFLDSLHKHVLNGRLQVYGAQKVITVFLTFWR